MFSFYAGIFCRLELKKNIDAMMLDQLIGRILISSGLSWSAFGK
jgi:hypothetical protein